MTSSMSLFVCLVVVAIMSHLPTPRASLLGIRGLADVVVQCALHHRRYRSLSRVSLHSASFQFHSFPV